LVYDILLANCTNQNEWEDFNPASKRPFFPNDVTQLTDGKWLSNCASRRELVGEVVEAVCDGSIFHDIAFVENVRACARNADFDAIGVLGIYRRVVRHTLQKSGHLFRVEVETCTRIDVGGVRDHLPARDVRRDTHVTVWKYNLDRFNSEMPGLIESNKLSWIATDVKASSQYSENMVATILTTMSSLV